MDVLREMNDKTRWQDKFTVFACFFANGHVKKHYQKLLLDAMLRGSCAMPLMFLHTLKSMPCDICNLLSMYMDVQAAPSICWWFDFHPQESLIALDRANTAFWPYTPPTLSISEMSFTPTVMVK